MSPKIDLLNRARPLPTPLSVLLHRVSALGRALLFAGGLALTASASVALAHEPHPAPQQHPSQSGHTSIESRDALPAGDVRGGEQIEVVSSGVRSVLRPPVAGSALTTAARAPSDTLRADALRWCDVIQCRRLGGALLLGFATPPPTHS